MADIRARLLERQDEVKAKLDEKVKSKSLLPHLVRIKLPRNGEHFEVITLYELLEDKAELERLGLTAEESKELQFAVVLGKLKAESFEGYIIEELEYRKLRADGLIKYLW